MPKTIMNEPVYVSMHPLVHIKRALVIYTRDLRVNDNHTLFLAGKYADEIINVFRFTDAQINPEKNKFFSHAAVQFMCESLDDLYDACDGKLSFYYDEMPPPSEYDAIFISSDYTHFAKNVRTKELKRFAKEHNKNLVFVENHLLDVPLSVTPVSTGKAYTKFTPYYNAFIKTYSPLILPSEKWKAKFIKCTKGAIKKSSIHDFYDYNENVPIKGGRKVALGIMRRLKDFKNYVKTRDDPSDEEGTTHMSAHNKFGSVSIREFFQFVADEFSRNHTLIKQLIWREFYYNIAVSYPEVTQGESLKPEYDKIAWSYDKAAIKAWKNGMTGYHFVDAGMRQLNETGYMHNRLRMVTASFLIKHLQIDWRVGEKYFATKLVDYDPIVNNGNWQWVSGSGADSQPYFRIFNPITQMEKFDKDLIYVKRYLPERSLDQSDDNSDDDSFIEPIVDHKDATAKTLAMYKRALK